LQASLCSLLTLTTCASPCYYVPHKYPRKGKWPDPKEALGELAHAKPVIADFVIGREGEVEEGSRQGPNEVLRIGGLIEYLSV
jgi:hypothetical protein